MVRRRPSIWPRARWLGASLALVLVGAVSGCGSSGPGDSGQVVQVWAIQDPQNQPIIEAGIEQFEQDSDADLRLTTYVNDAYKQKLQVSMGSSNAPDVFLNWGGGNLAQFVNAGQVEALSDALSRKPETSGAFLDSVLRVGQVNGVQYGLPMNGVQPVVLFYHKGVFDQAGARPPETYQDLLSLADTFQARGITPIVLPGAQGWTELMYLEYLYERVAEADKVQALIESEEGAWRDPAMLRALQMCQELVRRGAFGDNFSSINYDNASASALFASGRAAMFLMGTWEYTNLAQRQPDFFNSGNLAWTTFPTVAGGAGQSGSVVGNPSNYFSVRAGSEQADAATEFLVETLASDAYVEELIDSGQVPAIKGVDRRLAGTPNAEFATFVYQLVADAPSFTQSWDQALSPSVGNQLLTNLQKLFLLDITPEDFVAAMDRAQ